MTCIHDKIFNFSRNFKESTPSCHDEEACSRVRHGYIYYEYIYTYNYVFVLVLAISAIR